MSKEWFGGNKMKVLQVNSVCGVGSTGRIATDIHNLLIKQGHESHIAYGRGLSKNCNTTIKIGGKIDNYAHAAITRILDKHGFGSRKATKIFLKKVIALDPDIVHLHNIHGYYINIELLFNYLKESDKPIVWTLHDCWALTGHCVHFDHVDCNKWKTMCYDCPQKRLYPSSIIIDNSKKNYIKKKELFTGIRNLTIVTPSKWLAGLVKQSYLGGYPIEVINNGIDLEVFKPIQSNFRKEYNIENKFIILGVANVWGRRKGLGFFIEISQMLKNDEVIVLVGLTEKQKRKLPGNVIGITRTENANELAKVYTAADVFVNPTLEETFGLVNLEALACGTPVITFDTGGSIECIDQNTGFVVKKGNTCELLSRIRGIKDKGKQIYSGKAANRAKLLFDRRNKYYEYLDLYNRIYNY
jgi:putative colanic acid biosynthesis glycosyltransferase